MRPDKQKVFKGLPRLSIAVVVCIIFVQVAAVCRPALADVCEIVLDRSTSLLDRLSTYNADDWVDYIDKLATGRFEWSAPVADLAGGIPGKLKWMLLRECGRRYDSLEKQAPGHAYGPKRGVDAFIKATLDPGQLIFDEIDEGMSPLLAYEKYFDLIFRLRPSDAKWGGYRALDVFNSARIFQKHMCAVAKFEYQSRFDENKPVAIWFGSFPNGKANLLKSDIDWSTSFRDADFIPSEDGKVDPEARETRGGAGTIGINKYLTSSVGQESQLHLSTPFPFSYIEAGIASAFQPVAIGISCDSITLNIYRGNMGHWHKARVIVIK